MLFLALSSNYDPDNPEFIVLDEDRNGLVKGDMAKVATYIAKEFSNEEEIVESLRENDEEEVLESLREKGATIFMTEFYRILESVRRAENCEIPIWEE